MKMLNENRIKADINISFYNAFLQLSFPTTAKVWNEIYENVYLNSGLTFNTNYLFNGRPTLKEYLYLVMKFNRLW